MSEQAVFIWATALGSQQRIEWLKANYKSPITEEQYLAHIKELPHDHPKASRCRGNNRNRRDYHNLKDKFGFFTPEARAE